MTWSDIWKMEDHRIGYLLRSVYDVLPTPTNLKTWGLTDDPCCKLCGRPANLEHVLSSCSKALADGRYTWRHDKILGEIAATIDTARRRKTQLAKGVTFIHFVNAGKTANTSRRPTGVLATVNDWDLQVDLRKRLIFPSEIAISNLRPDALLVSRKTKQLVLVELTVPCEERMEKTSHRQDLQAGRSSISVVMAKERASLGS